jgi:hypothetical protein
MARDSLEPPLLDIGSYGRWGTGRRDRLSSAQIAYIARTVHGAPEVMLKVLTQGGRGLKSVAAHFKYLGRDGDLAIETDDGQHIEGEKVGQQLVDDWDLPLEERLHTLASRARESTRPPRLVHKLMFSMPVGTPPQKVLAAVRTFAREEFGARHRYAMVLHTDEPHPHVHVIVKAMSEDGRRRLNIRKATLREWRAQFARRLREQGVEANATPRAARGQTRGAKLDGIYRAAARGESTHYREKAAEIAGEIRGGFATGDPGKKRLLETRRLVVKGWRAVGDQLVIQGELDLARAVRVFVARMPPPVTEKERLRAKLLERVRTKWREAPTR